MTSVKKLVTKDIGKRLEKISGWELRGKGTVIVKRFSFPNFITALGFVAKITVHAEVLGHHPTIELSYTEVIVRLSTHDVKGLTKLDFELAKRIDQIRNK